MRLPSLVQSAALTAAFVISLLVSPAGATTVIRIGAGYQSTGTNPPSAGISQATFTDGRKLLEQEFSKDDVKIEWKYYHGGGAVINQALADKELDFAFLGDFAAIYGEANGNNTRLLASGRGGQYYLAVAKDSSWTKFDDVRGKKVALEKGTNFEISFNKALEKYGLKPSDVHIIDARQFNDASADLAAKEVDAIWVGGQILPLRDKGDVKVITNSEGIGKEYLNQAAFVGSTDFITAHPDLTQRVVNVTVKTRQFINQPENYETYLTETAKASGVNPDNARNAFAVILDHKFASSPRLDDYTLDVYQWKVEKAKGAGIIPTAFDVKSWAEPKFVEEALKQTELQNAWPKYDVKGEPAKDAKI